MQVQIVYSMMSQKLHGRNPLEKSTTELYAEIHNQYMGVPYVEGTVCIKINFNNKSHCHTVRNGDVIP